MQLFLPLPELMVPADGAFPVPPARRIYCNRNLRLDQVDLVGFDMDYTLAIYNQEAMDRLSIEATTRKLVERGYPETLLGMRYRTDYPIRGLLIDRKRGNVLKMDRYRYVKKAFHGLRELTREERRGLYHINRLRTESGRYHFVDTLYALAEVSVFAAVVEELELEDRQVDYEELFNDVRACIDLAHQDGSILDSVICDLPRFVQPDPQLGPALHKLRSSGKRLFLLTNSRAEYTEQMMSYLLDRALPAYPSWRNYFDVVITAAAKPSFFVDATPFMEQTDEGLRRASTLERGPIYIGGNITEFERLVGVGGDRILYVGDHIYGDVLRAKKESAWRTAMIIQEMDQELEATERNAERLSRIGELENRRDVLYDGVRERQARLRAVQRRLDQLAAEGEPPPSELESVVLRHRRAIERLRAQIRSIEAEHNAIEDEVDHQFHPFWGSLFKAGPEKSSFGDQVEMYACVYTTRVSNFLLYSPMHYFRSPMDRMPHELRFLSAAEPW